MAEGAGQITVRKTIEKKLLKNMLGKFNPTKNREKSQKKKTHFGTISMQTNNHQWDVYHKLSS